jgi:hypothetical protein
MGIKKPEFDANFESVDENCKKSLAKKVICEK